MFASVRRAIKEQNLQQLAEKLSEIVPDISQQYSGFRLESAYFVTKVRGVHAFQIKLVQEAISMLNCGKAERKLTVLDIGDSAGTHIRYLKCLFPGLEGVSVNLDLRAVERIRESGGKALHMRAEEVAKLDIHPDLLISFEMLEHLSDPISFMHSLSEADIGQSFVLTVPYVEQSRVALSHIRNNQIGKDFCAENTHIFELSPMDWKLIFQHAGWGIVTERFYHQYPTRFPWKLTKPLWRTIDHEGFWGVILRKDQRWSSIYKDW